MKRVMLTVAYDGTNYHGWQLQDGQVTIESELNSALSRITGEDIKVSGASRTDAGVHAKGNLCVFDTEARMPGEKFSYALNTCLNEDIRVVDSVEVADDFHPRFTKTEKTYCYRIYNSKFANPLYRLYSHHSYIPLNIDLMNKGAEFLIGEHDFKSFSSVHASVKTTVRQITGAEIKRSGELIEINIKGYGFLYNMVRIISGSLMEVGSGKYPPERIGEILAARDRAAAGPTAPAKGLTLENIRIL